MIIRALFPGTVHEFDADAPGGRDTLFELYEPPNSRWLRLNFVASANGSAMGEDGTSHSLSNRTDRRILGTIRNLADVVLVGANSVRSEGYLLPRTAPLAIVTGSGDLRGHRIPHDVAEGRVIVLCPTAATARARRTLNGARATVVELPVNGSENRVDPSIAIGALRERGFERIVCEGGPALAAQLVESRLVDELCLTTSAQLSPRDLAVLPGLASTHPLNLTQLLADDGGNLYARWTITP